MSQDVQYEPHAQQQCSAPRLKIYQGKLNGAGRAKFTFIPKSACLSKLRHCAPMKEMVQRASGKLVMVPYYFEIS